MRYEAFLCFKYLKSKKRQKFISFISIMSILGVATGVCALIVVISVMNGFERELIEKFIGMDAHMSVEQSSGMIPYTELEQVLLKIDGVVAVAPQLSGQVLLRSHSRARGVIVRGIDLEKEYSVSKLRESLLDTVSVESFENENTLLMGRELAQSLGLIVGDTVSVISPVNVMQKRMRRPLVETYRIAAIFQTHMYDFDSTFIYMSLLNLRRLYKLDEGTVARAHLFLDSLDHMESFKNQLKINLGEDTQVKAWYDRNRSLFSALKLEKTAMFVILLLIILVSVFNIASSLIMVIMEKTKEIGILKALGATRSSIRLIFSLEGLFIGCLGTGLGVGLGFSLCWFLEHSDLIQLPSDIYYVSHLPVHMEMFDLWIIIGSSITLSFLSTLYPAFFASRLDPVEALRYE
jgi:lipoprotein-releasing system permease protein